MMQREGWEYLTLFLRPPAENAAWAETLNERGRLGWEVVAIERDRALVTPGVNARQEGVIVVFKRSIGVVQIPPHVEPRELNQ